MGWRHWAAISPSWTGAAHRHAGHRRWFAELGGRRGVLDQKKLGRPAGAVALLLVAAFGAGGHRPDLVPAGVNELAGDRVTEEGVCSTVCPL